MTERIQSKFDNLVVTATAHHEAGRLTDAEATYCAALAVSPGHVAVTHNLGVVAAAQGRHHSAIARFDDAIAREPRYASAHYNRAVALQALGRTHEAIRGFSRACTVEPEHYDAHRALGFLWLSQGNRGRALDHFARTCELRRGEDRSGRAAMSLTTATRGKLLHDAEQFRFLAERRRDSQRFDTLARAYEQVAVDVPEESTGLLRRQLDLLGGDYNTAIHVCDAPELADRAVRVRQDGHSIMRQFGGHPAGAVQVDDLLTPHALLGLRRFLLESTIWHDFSHISGFVASHLEDGLACPLLLQIADELRSTFPELLGRHPLSQAWAFKGLQSGSTIDVHADDAAISVNLWVTPTQANLHPGRGGLAVCRAPPPPDWEIKGYKADTAPIVAFLEHNADNTLLVPYRENRAVLFESRRLHWSDEPRFEPSYENHRINLTFLFDHHGR